MGLEYINMAYRDLPEALLQQADSIDIGETDCLTQQYHTADYLYYLVSGRLAFYISLGTQGEQLFVGEASLAGTIIGWSGLRSPNRYATTVCAMSECHLIRLKQTDVVAYFQAQPLAAIRLLENVLNTGFELLQQVRALLASQVKQAEANLHYIYPRFKTCFRLEQGIVRSWLQNSAFFDSFDEPSQKILLDNMELQRCYSGETVLTAGKQTETLYILVNGSVNLYHEPQSGANKGKVVFLRSLSSQGQVLNVQSVQQAVQPELTVITNQDSLLCCLSSKALHESMKRDPDFGLALQSALLSLMGNQLRSSRVQLVNQIYDDELFNIRGILKQAVPQLSVTSSLHKVPHLLENRLCHGDAFRCLELAQVEGTALEKNLAGLCLDVLTETKTEWQFYQGLQQVYQAVTEAPPEQDASSLRKLNADCFREAFTKIRYLIKGEEHLPDTPGHIFILNHLVSHPYHVLPNHFELSLDTNFVSAMILDQHYGNSGMRVVRKGRQDEYAHHNYYSRLGYLSVVTEESGPVNETNESRSQTSRFLDEARDCLKQGRNIVICPEGRSLWSDESPGPFKPGAFLLAAGMDPEPCIVPIAMVNFDKRLHNKRLVALIKPPFRVSEHVDVNDKQALKRFLAEYQTIYRGYVEEAQQLAMSRT